MFDDDQYETVWISKYGDEQGSNTTLTVNFADYYYVNSVILSFPDYYEAIPDLRIFSGQFDRDNRDVLILQHEWSTDDEPTMKEDFVSGVKRVLKFEARTTETNQLKIVFDNDCEYVKLVTSVFILGRKV